ncbi:MAG: 50S ribosomal protein L25 [Candidatus Taylorbacteria bacterium]|nr:50S ribosomal protein L25 [Candidatus Taylorbacteria bacterium]
MLKLKAEKRAPGRAERLRREGKLPAVLYGRKEETTPVSVLMRDFLKVWGRAGESAVITLEADGAEKEVLIAEVDRHPVTGEPRHADFYVIEKGKKLKVKVPLDFVGTAAAVKDLGGTLIKVLRELEVESLPKYLPVSLNVDVTPLVGLDSRILAKNVSLPEGVSLITLPEEVVAAVVPPREEEKEEAPPDLTAIEVEKKGKVAAEEGAPPGAEPAPETAEAPKTPPAA